MTTVYLFCFVFFFSFLIPSSNKFGYRWSEMCSVLSITLTDVELENRLWCTSAEPPAELWTLADFPSLWTCWEECLSEVLSAGKPEGMSCTERQGPRRVIWLVQRALQQGGLCQTSVNTSVHVHHLRFITQDISSAWFQPTIFRYWWHENEFLLC